MFKRDFLTRFYDASVCRSYWSVLLTSVKVSAATLILTSFVLLGNLGTSIAIPYSMDRECEDDNTNFWECCGDVAGDWNACISTSTYTDGRVRKFGEDQGSEGNPKILGQSAGSYSTQRFQSESRISPPSISKYKQTISQKCVSSPLVITDYDETQSWNNCNGTIAISDKNKTKARKKYAGKWRDKKFQGRGTVKEGIQAIFTKFARELLVGINSASVEDIPATAGYGKPRIAVAPFRNTDKFVSKSVASELNTRLLAELTSQGSRTYKFVAREALHDIIREVHRVEELETGSEDSAVNLLHNAKVDILIVGALRKEGGKVTLSYKAVSLLDGIVFAATRPRDLWLSRPHPAIMGRKDQRKPFARNLRRLRDGILFPGGKPTILQSQRFLTVLGYDPGPLDGLMRPRLRAAIRAYQRDFRQVDTGRMTRRLMSRMRANVTGKGGIGFVVP